LSMRESTGTAESTHIEQGWQGAWVCAAVGGGGWVGREGSPAQWPHPLPHLSQAAVGSLQRQLSSNNPTTDTLQHQPTTMATAGTHLEAHGGDIQQAFQLQCTNFCNLRFAVTCNVFQRHVLVPDGLPGLPPLRILVPHKTKQAQRILVGGHGLIEARVPEVAVAFVLQPPRLKQALRYGQRLAWRAQPKPQTKVPPATQATLVNGLNSSQRQAQAAAKRGWGLG
jgi:hypothetical protein